MALVFFFFFFFFFGGGGGGVGGGGFGCLLTSEAYWRGRLGLCLFFRQIQIIASASLKSIIARVICVALFFAFGGYSSLMFIRLG